MGSVGANKGNAGAANMVARPQEPAQNQLTNTTTTATDLNDNQRNYILAMTNTVRADLERALVDADIRPRDARNAVSYLNFSSSTKPSDIPQYITADVDVSTDVSPSGLARVTFEIQYQFTGRTFTRQNGTRTTQYSYRGVKLVNRGVSAY